MPNVPGICFANSEEEFSKTSWPGQGTPPGRGWFAPKAHRTLENDAVELVVGFSLYVGLNMVFVSTSYSMTIYLLMRCGAPRLADTY